MSSATPEAKFKARIQRATREALSRAGLKAKLVWHAGSGWGGADDVDCTGVVQGRAIAVEVKRPDKKGTLTLRQKMTLREYDDAGAFTLVIDSEQKLAKWLEWLGTTAPLGNLPEDEKEWNA